MALTSRRFFLRRTKMPDFLNELEGTTDPSAVSVYLPPGLSAAEIEDLLIKTALPLPEEMAETVAGSSNGAALFWGSQRKCLVLPPFPIRKRAIFNGLDTTSLRQLLDSDFKIGLVLVHLGSYAIGLYQGEKLIASKVGTGLVHGRHKKGGSSQARFQRRRQNQAHEFLDRVCRHAREQLAPHAPALDYLAYGGPRQTVLRLRNRCPFLKSLEDRTLPLLEVPSLRQKVLEATVSRVWSSCIIEWPEES